MSRFKYVPNIITSLNITAGVVSVIMSMEGYLLTAVLLIFAGCIFDFLDGLSARLLNAWSEFGKQLDSLADIITFGIAPSLVLYKLFLDTPELQGNKFILVYVIAACSAIVVFSALRLARFNISNENKSYFTGLPTPANAIIISSLVFTGNIALSFQALMIITISLCFLLVSNIRMLTLKFENFSIKTNFPRYIFLLCTLISVVLFKHSSLIIVMLLYVVISLATHISCRRAK